MYSYPIYSGQKLHEFRDNGSFLFKIQRLKAQINKEIEENDIEIYQFPDCDSDEDEDFHAQDKQLKQSIPFAIVASTQVLEVGPEGFLSY